MTPTPADLIAIMVEVRDASSYERNPHDPRCLSRAILGGACNCSRARRIVAAWRAYHDALAAAGVPPLTFEEK